METFHQEYGHNLWLEFEEKELYEQTLIILQTIQDNHGRGIVIRACTYLSQPTQQWIHDLHIMWITPEEMQKLNDLMRLADSIGEERDHWENIIMNAIAHLTDKLVASFPKSPEIGPEFQKQLLNVLGN